MNALIKLLRTYRRNRFRAWLRRNRVILPAPKADERSSIESFNRIMRAR